MTHFCLRFSLASLIIALTLLSGCKPSGNNAGNNAEPVAEPLVKPLILAVHPFDVPSKVQLHFAPILNYLSHTLNQPVQLYVATSYEDQIRKIATNQVDLAYLGPSSFVTALDKFTDEHGLKIQPIATEQPYQAALVVQQNSPIQSWQDLKGKSFAFGSYFSYAGHFWVRTAMRNQNVPLADLQLYSFMGRHERAVLSVAYGNFDAAATTLGIAERMRNLNYPIKIIETSEKLAPIVFVAAPNMAKTRVAQLQASMIHPDFEAQEQITTFAPGGQYYAYQAWDYDAVRQSILAIEQ